MNITPVDFARRHLGEYKTKRTRQGLQIIARICPYCGGGKHHDKGTFAMNAETGAFNCKRGTCGVSGTFYKLLLDFGEVDITDTREYKQYKAKKTFKKSTVKINAASSKVLDYLKLRGISEDTCRVYSVGDDGKGNIAFPYIKNGVQAAVKYRPAHKIKKGEMKMWREEGTDTTILFGMQTVAGDNLTICEGECFPGSAEVLTPHGWVPFDRYGGQPVLQVNSDLTAMFVQPTAYIKKPYNGQLLRVEKGGNYVTMTTPEHNIVYVVNGKLVKRKVVEMPETINGFIPTTVTIDGPGILLNNDQIALCIAVSADGTVDHRTSGGNRNGILPKEMRYVRMSFSKQRKIDRLTGILERLDIDYSRNIIAGGKTCVCFSYPDWGTEKLFHQEWISMATLEQRKFILDEMVYWDGNSVPGRNQTEYSTKHYHNAVFMQTIAHTCGIMSTIMERKNSIGKWYKVSILHCKKSVSWQRTTPQKIPLDDYVYCVTVPSGMILVRQEGHITVTGNCDALALYESGIQNVVSIPNGSEDLNWVETNFQWLEQFKVIYLCGDNDEPGHDMIQRLIPKLGEDRVKVVELPEDCKDANEVLVKHGKQIIIDAFKNAKEIPVEALVRMAEVKAFDIDKIVKVASGIRGLDRKIGGFMMGQVSVWTGINGSGKSTLLGQLLIETIESGFNVCAFSGELPNPLFRYWIELQMAGPENLSHKYDYILEGDRAYVENQTAVQIRAWYYDNFFLYDSMSVIDIDSVMRVFTTAARRHDCKIFLVDNLMMLIGGTGDDYYRRQSEFIKTVSTFAKKFDVHVHVVAHPKKTKGRVEKMDISGSGDITNLADNAFGVHRITNNDREDKDMVGYAECDTLLDVFKSRFTGRQEITIGLKFHEDCKRFYMAKDDSLLRKHYSWERQAEEEKGDAWEPDSDCPF